MEQGTILITKDGTITGNAIIFRKFGKVEINKIASSLLYYLESTQQDLYEVITDFGNISKLSTNEINEQYFIGDKINFHEWHCARWEKIIKLNEIVYGHESRLTPEFYRAKSS